MLKPDTNVLKAISALQNNSDFAIFFEWMQKSSMELDKIAICDAVTADHTHRVSQGRALACRQIINVIEEADKRLRAITSNDQK